MKQMSLSDYIDLLSERFPTNLPVRVIRCVMPVDPKTGWREFGDCKKLKARYKIRINNTHPLQIQKDTLEHEWAHCIDRWSKRQDHDSRWGALYAKIYRTMNK